MAATGGCRAAADDVGASLGQCNGAAVLEDCVPVPCRAQGLDEQTCTDVLLAQAAQRGDVEDIRAALGKGGKVDTCADLCLNMGEAAMGNPKGITPLMRACACGHEAAILMLLQARASPTRSDMQRWTPLCHAVAHGELAAARLLLEHSGAGVAERQKASAHCCRSALLEHCEEAADEALAEELRRAFEKGGFLAKAEPRRV